MFKPILNTFVYKALAAILNLATVIIISRYMGAETKGESSIILTTITFMLISSNLIGGSTLVYLTPRYSLLTLIAPSYIWTVFSGVITTAFIFYLKIIPDAFIFHVLGLAILNDIMSTNLNILLGKEKVSSFNRISLLQIFISLSTLLIMLFVFNMNNIFAYIVSLYISYGFCALYSFYKIFKWINPIESNKFKNALLEMIKVGFTNQASHLIQFFSWRLSYYIISEQNGDSALGIFSNGVSLAESAWILINSIITVQYSMVSNNPTEAANITNKALKLGIMICIPFLLLISILPDTFYTYLFGSDFIGIQKIIVLLAPGIFMYSIALIIGHFYSGIGKYSVNTIGNLIGLILTVILSYFYLSDYSINTAAIICSLSYSASCLFVLYNFRTDTKIGYLSMLPSIKNIKQNFIDIKSAILSKKK